MCTENLFYKFPVFRLKDRTIRNSSAIEAYTFSLKTCLNFALSFPYACVNEYQASIKKVTRCIVKY